ncbi:MAG: NADH-quinone oxidoreductase subunit NuoE [Armatimonadetes bacterium]|nr:NADH-quinone oxidoreductase subunit NuoE [Armatimonadota bacterium]
MDIATLDKLCDRYAHERGAIVELLQTIQTEEHYLPRDALERVSANLDIPLSQLYGLATFYRAFSLKPVGKHQVLCCTGTACHVRGAKRVVDHFRRVLGIEIGETTEDGLFSLHTVNCLGACAVAPVAVIDGVCHGEMTAANVEKLVRQYRSRSGE